MEDKYNFSDFSDSEDDASDFRNTVAAVQKLDNHKQVLPAERSEPSLKVDEYHLTKEGDSSAVKLSELTRTLSKQPKHSKIARDLKVAQKKTRTLPKPLEKPAAERVSRSVGFEKVQRQLSYWDPVVHENRLAEHQVFPLPNPEDSSITAQDFTSTIVPETDLEKRMAEILKRNNPNLDKIEDGSSIFQLTLEEMIEKRKEAARLRAQQSYMVAKARRQNKIKSKTYHRIARRERIRQQMKEFETLQQTNPEEALKRIEELEKERALERVSLRHRNTGKWAKNQAVRAKYNKESREVLSEQLKLSRDLTKKVPVDSESSGEDEDIANSLNVAESDNPWVGGERAKTEAEIDNFISGYRKFWDAKQQVQEQEKEDEEESKRKAELEVAEEQGAQRLLKSAVVAASASVLLEDDVKSDDPIGASTKDDEKAESKQSKNDTSTKTAPIICKAVKRKENLAKPKECPVVNSARALTKQSKNDSNKRKSDETEGCSMKKKRRPVASEVGSTEVASMNLVKEVNVVNSKSGKWTVTVKQEQKLVGKKSDLRRKRREINSMFNKMESKLQEKADKKMGKLKKDLGLEEDGIKKRNRNSKAEKKAKKVDLSVVLPLRGARHQRPDEDEALDEQSGNRKSIPAEKDTPVSKDTRVTEAKAEGSANPDVVPEIDPNNFLKTVRTQLENAVPDLLANGDEGMDDDETNHLTISEAFADDDVVAEFEQEKNEEIESNKPKDIDLSLPGWGSWGGHKIKPNERKMKRFIVKAPQQAKRRDGNKGNLYINEKEENKLKPQQVSELPFPFKSVKDFQASVGAPISNTFIPESAHRKLILPKVITKTGTIISPLSKDVLTQRKKRKDKMKEEKMEALEAKKAMKS